LNDGDYILKINFLDRRLNKLFDFEAAARFSVTDVNRGETATYGRFDGYVHPRLFWKTQVLKTQELQAQDAAVVDPPKQKEI
jgi:hypothetical protein